LKSVSPRERTGVSDFLLTTKKILKKSELGRATQKECFVVIILMKYRNALFPSANRYICTCYFHAGVHGWHDVPAQDDDAEKDVVAADTKEQSFLPKYSFPASMA
jgi:hypothetical protein